MHYILLNFEKLYDDVMNLDPNIRYGAIQNTTGEKIHGGFRDGVTPILDDDELKMMHYYASQRWQTRKNIEHKLGNTRYAMAEYDKLKRISFPLDEKHLLLITADTGINHTNVISEVLKLIQNSSNHS